MITLNESQHIEWKENWRDDYLKWVCAFANTDGGILYIGKDDNGNAVGVANYLKLLEDIPSKIKNSMGIICSVNLHNENTQHFIEIIVLPYSVLVSYRGKYYIRSGSSTHELNGVQLSDFLLRKSGQTWDEIIVEDATIEDIDSSTIDQFINESKGKGRLPNTNGLSNQQILEKLRLINGSQIKRAAIVLFGKDPNKFFPNCKVMIGRFGKDAEDLKFQEIVEGNLVYLLDQTEKMLNYKFLIRPVGFEGMHRVEDDEYPVSAIREMLLNALVHKKYMGAAIQIRVFNDRLSIWNEGLLPAGMTIDSLKEEHNSKPSNPVLADACFKAGYIDTWGRGTLKIYKACLEVGLPEPRIIEKDGGIEVTLYKTKTSEKIRNKFGTNSEQIRNKFGTNSEQIRRDFGVKVEETFKIITQNPGYTANQIAKTLNITSRTVENHQAKLKNSGYIKRIGDNIGGYWKIILKHKE